MSVDLVRLLIGDRKKAAVNEVVGEGDDTNLNFQLDMFPLVSSPTATLEVNISGVIIVAANYNISGDVGRLTFISAPTAGADILATYEYFALTSGEISNILSGLSATPYLAAANAALVLAADNSRLFAYSMGDKTVDKRRVSDNLRGLSKDLKDTHFTMKGEINTTASQFTFKDDSGTWYAGYDSAAANLNTDDV